MSVLFVACVLWCASVIARLLVLSLPFQQELDVLGYDGNNGVVIVVIVVIVYGYRRLCV